MLPTFVAAALRDDRVLAKMASKTGVPMNFLKEEYECALKLDAAKGTPEEKDLQTAFLVLQKRNEDAR